MTTSPFRNRECVIRAILRREREGLPLNCEAIKGVSKPLYGGALRHFGSWRSALRAAGINAATVERRREWDRAKIVARLRELCRRHRSLRQRAVNRYDSGLYRAACLTFGSWCNALVAAGINPESICRDPHWDRSKIIEAILLRVLRGEALGSTTVRPRTLKSAAVREFGSWPEALVTAGLNPAHYIGQRVASPKEGERGGWSKERVRKAILQRHALGLPLYGNAVLRDDRTLFCAGRTWFKNWSRALAYAGFDPTRVDGLGVDAVFCGVQKSTGFLAEHGDRLGRGGFVEK